MFCHQLNTANKNLMSPGTVESSYERDVTVDDLPLVTICPTNQTNDTRLVELGYFGQLELMLMGQFKCDPVWCTSWGAHKNLTFDELKTQVFNLDKVRELDIVGGKFKNSSEFLPGYGLCKETALFDNTQKFTLVNNNPDEARVWITDRHYRSYFMPSVESHIGQGYNDGLMDMKFIFRWYRN